ncbi:hypothetical protein BJ741DRAFT_670269 [Chytriomyces cf. hyalinus JEL632]|nr:hypothetical protein BJ741DRAFT_670269 [Chytriomyces cf. hyalinus JEL632]
MIKIWTFSSLLAMVAVTFALIGVCGLDLYIQILRIRENVAMLTTTLFILSGSLLALALFSVSILSVRKLRVARGLAQIPRNFVPINDHLPQSILLKAVQGMTESAAIRAAMKPLSHEWSVGRYDQDTPVHFKTAMRKTLSIFSDTVSNPAHDLAYNGHQPLQEYFDSLSARNVQLNPHFAKVYLRNYESMAQNPNEATEREYIEFMKVFSLLLRSLDVVE